MGEGTALSNRPFSPPLHNHLEGLAWNKIRIRRQGRRPLDSQYSTIFFLYLSGCRCGADLLPLKNQARLSLGAATDCPRPARLCIAARLPHRLS